MADRPDPTLQSAEITPADTPSPPAAAALEALAGQAAAYARHGTAQATRQAYARDWADFAA